jgi:hypothetical protein
MTETSTAAQNTVRGDIFVDGHDDWVSMAEVRGCISRGRLTDLASEQQQLMLQTIRALLLDGLVEFGDIPAPGDPGFLVWPGTLEEVIAGFAQRIVGRYGDPDSWEYVDMGLAARVGERATGVTRAGASYLAQETASSAALAAALNPVVSE